MRRGFEIDETPISGRPTAAPRVERDELLLVRCPHCKEKLGEYVPGEKVRLRAGGLVIEWLPKSRCVHCDGVVYFKASDDLAKLLRRKGASEEQIKQIFMEMG